LRFIEAKGAVGHVALFYRNRRGNKAVRSQVLGKV
jgi:hypothetical protein